MSGKAIAGTLLALFLLVAVAVGVGLPAYQFGVAQGMADTGKIVVPPATAGVPYMYGPFFPYGRFGWGFGPLGCLIPLFGFFIVFGVLRMLFWGAPRRWHRYGRWGDDAPPVFSEWHRRAHGEPPAEPQTKTNG